MKCHYQLVEYFFKPKYTNGNRGETMLKIKFTLTLGEKMFYWSKIRVLIEISSINFIFWSIKLTVFFLFLRSIWSFLIKISVSSLLGRMLLIAEYCTTDVTPQICENFRVTHRIKGYNIYTSQGQFGIFLAISFECQWEQYSLSNFLNEFL